MYHKNAGYSTTGPGTSNIAINFLGAGIEAKLSKLFGVDLSYMIPAGDKKLGWTLDSSYNVVTSIEMEPMVKLGFIFSFYL